MLSDETRSYRINGHVSNILQQDAGLRGGTFSYAPLGQVSQATPIVTVPVIKGNNRIMVDVSPFYPYPSHWMRTNPAYMTYPNRQIGFDGNGRPIPNDFPYYNERMPGLESFDNNIGYAGYFIAIILLALFIFRHNMKK